MAPSTHTPASERSSGRSRPEDRYAFRFDTRYFLAGLAFGVSPWSAWIRVTDTELVVRFGPWSVRTPLANVAGTQQTGPFALVKTIGPAHLSFVDHGATFATNPNAGLCIEFREALPILFPGGVVKSPALTVTAAEIDRLRTAIRGGVTGGPGR